jgi:hypothetical protein
VSDGGPLELACALAGGDGATSATERLAGANVLVRGGEMRE